MERFTNFSDLAPTDKKACLRWLFTVVIKEHTALHCILDDSFPDEIVGRAFGLFGVGTTIATWPG